jgi:hypothetical protein
MRRALIIALLLIVAGGAWVYFFTGTPILGAKLPLKDAPVASIELHWGDTAQTVSTSNECAAVIQTMRIARQFPATVTPSFGFVTIHYVDGTTNQWFLSPSGRFAALEMANHSGGYAISTRELTSTFEAVKLLPIHH